MSSRMTWFATFASGFGPLVRRIVERDVPGSRERRLEDNALTFECPGEPRDVLAYCRSLFRVLGERRAGPAGSGRGEAASVLGAAAEEFARGRDALGDLARGRPGPFTLRGFGPEDPASIPDAARRALEEAIARSCGGRPDPRGGPRSREFRLQARADGTVLFLERRGGREEGTRAGELPRTTCRLLAELTEPRPDDVFLDPFCGYGGIALERAVAAPYRFVFASDIDPAKAEAVKDALRDRAFERRRRTIFPKVRNALDGSAFEPSFISAIATDPPWGLYEGGPGVDDAAGLLVDFLDEAAREMRADGRLVLLVARDQAAGAAEAAGASFVPRERLDVLVSGRKASALRFDRKP
jgi:predicted RNA methylase